MREVEELRQMSTDELEQLIEESHRELYRLHNRQEIQKKCEKPHLFGALRKKIARAHTLLTERNRLKQNNIASQE